ncbi:MAG: hypothetical protein CMP30_03565 [Roseibacillus sp.]|nr:hypothetical protein [Roseibacillus sp.]
MISVGSRLIPSLQLNYNGNQLGLIMSTRLISRLSIGVILAAIVFFGAQVGYADTKKIAKVEFDEANLSDLISFLREGSSGTVRNVIVDPRVNRELRVSLRLYDVTKGVAFAYAAELGGFDYREDRYAIRIVPRSVSARVRPFLKRGSPVIARRLAEIRMPKVEFDETDLGQVVEDLVEATRRLDSSKKGINILLGPGVDSSSQVTLQLQNIPVGQVLNYIAEFSKLKIRIDGNAILLLDRKSGGK